MRTRAEHLHQVLRGDILAGRQQPGHKLPLAEIAEQYHSRIGLMREVLLRLSEEGLVVAEPQIGFRVAPLSVADLRHLTETRCAIEGLVLGMSVAQGDVEWETRVIATHYRLSRTPQMESNDHQRVSDEWAVVHADYHRALLSGCRNPRLLSIALKLRDSAELYRRWSVPLGEEKRDVADEHRNLRDAATARNAELAKVLLCDHIELTSQLLLNSQSNTTDESASNTTPAEFQNYIDISNIDSDDVSTGRSKSTTPGLRGS